MDQYRKRLARIIGGFRGRTVGVLGDYMLDELLRGDATRISPEAPVPVVLMPAAAGAREGFPGGAGNVAANVAALGGRPVPFGAIGRDPTGARLLALLKGRGITTRTLVQEAGRMTPRKVRIVAHQQQLLRLDFEAPAKVSSRGAALIEKRFGEWARRLDALVVSDYQKGSVTTELCNAITTLARQRRVPVLVDPKPDHPEICRHATVVTPNLREAELMAGVPLGDRDQRRIHGPRLRAELQCGALLITRGGAGMTLVEEGGRVSEIPSVARPVYDVTGAGDTVIAVLAMALSAGATLGEAASLANLAGGCVVLKFGTAGITAAELRRAIL
ncbi:MAG TPA: PfkB family carbohydrate kinase [Terriglobia bacterium]|nr:PfkB family carbohydrate kinase [Terriglobia bacterium]